MGEDSYLTRYPRPAILAAMSGPLQSLIYRKSRADPEWLYTRRDIADYLGVSVSTLKRWVISAGFPAGPLPNGTWVSSRSAIRQWVAARGQVATRRERGDIDEQA